MVEVNRSEGYTDTERYLKRLCDKSFLSVWSYPNLYRDQGKKKDGSGDGKEICDLLVIFGNDIIIFSERTCRFPNSGNLEVDWQRWYRRVIAKQFATIVGAENWIKEHIDRIYLDKQCTQRLPFSFSNPGLFKFHRIIVARGAGDRCRIHLGGSGSLMFVNDAAVKDNLIFDSKPFLVGSVGGTEKFVHIFDDVTTDIIISELDTIVDFVRYLREKENFVTSGRLAAYAGEEDLLAFYLNSRLQDRIHFLLDKNEISSELRPPAYQPRATILVKDSNISDSGEFLFPEVTDGALVVPERCWSELNASDQYKRYKEDKRKSYHWDRFMEMLGQNLLHDRLQEIIPENALSRSLRGFALHEKNLRLLASTSRQERRTLVRVIDDLYASYKPGQIKFRAFKLARSADTAYLFLLVPNSENLAHEAYREARRAWLAAYCCVFKFRQKQLKYIIGIATEAPGNKGASEDILHIDDDDWTEEWEKEAADLQERTQILVGFKWSSFDDNTSRLRTMRNQRKRQRQQAQKRKR